ncbi:MAG: SUMF1/EgtB/PvdO family nonheme iron enzyme [Planctomycetota bacterium]|nr:SUMF1/EgtB/PvdO family nonheme iron enzyme [Planctomycetota bacterium]
MILTTALWFNGRELSAKLNADLPFEAQWECACRAGGTNPFSDTGTMRELGWNIDSAERKLQSFGLKQPSAFGLFDMHGDAQE